MTLYDPIAPIYDAWSRSVVEDVSFYVRSALGAGGTVVELGVGTGRIAVPTAQAGVRVLGIDSSPGMLELCRARAESAGVEHLLELRLGDLRRPPVEQRVPLVTSPFRAFLHLRDSPERLRTLRALRRLLLPGGRLVFDVFAPSREDVRSTHDRWIEREPGIWEHALWDPQQQTLALRVRGPSGEAALQLSWLAASEWQRLLERAGFEVEALYGWFDRRPYNGEEDMVFVARRLEVRASADAARRA